jgi:hypothetical protein
VMALASADSNGQAAGGVEIRPPEKH